ncbi:MAG: PAS domain S-box protein [Flavobacteriia bacterium]|nr:PAS domain S-box protein [Flavobacteriia bacterium]
MKGKKNRDQFSSYYEQENDNIRLSNLLLIFSFFFCPLFAYFFYFIHSPTVYVYSLLSGSFVLPFFIFINRFITFFKGKLPWMYFLFFIAITQAVIFDLYKQKFEEQAIIYFVCLFCLFNFALQRLNFSLVYFISSFLSLIYFLLKIDEENFFSYHLYLVVLIASSGIFFMIIYRSRNSMINTIEDNNSYLKKLVNHLGNGVLLLQNRSGIFQVVDFNKMSTKFFKTDDIFELSNIVEKFVTEKELYALDVLNEDEFYKKEFTYDDNTIFELKMNKIQLKKGIYYILLFEDISQIIEEKRDLEINQKKYKNLYVRNQTGLFTINESAEILDCNPTFLNIFKINDFKEIKLFTEKEWKNLKEQLVLNGFISNFQYSYKKSIEENFYLVINLYYDKESDLIEGNLVNVTELTLSTYELEEKEKKYRLIYEESKDAILILEDEIIIDINQKGLELYDSERENVLGKNIWDFTYHQTPELKESLFLKFEELRNLKVVKFSWNFANKNNFVETSVTIAPIHIGEKLLFQCVIHDETERNKYLNQLEESKKSFESIIENTPEGFLIVRNKKVVFANKEFFSIFQIEKNQTIELGKELFGVNYEKINLLLRQAVEEKNKVQKQLQFLINKKVVEIDLTIASIIFEKEDDILMIFKDISYQNKLSKEQLRAELAEETNKRLSKEIEERKLVERKLETEFLRTKAIFDSSENTFLMTLTPDLVISSFNVHSKHFFDFHTQKDLQANTNFEKYFEEIISAVKLRYFRFILSSIKKGKSYQLQLKFINKNLQRKWLEVYLNPIIDLNGVVSEISFVAHDITEKKNNEREVLQSLKEKEVLLKEVHHRVKNNLQIISSILNLQSTYVTDEKTLEIIEESRHRIRTMAIIHENLYQNTNFSSINFKNYSRELLRNLISTYHFNQKIPVKVVEEVDLVELSLDQAIPCGLIINELITNSLKYAFKENKGEGGEIYLELKEIEGQIQLNIGDNGIGLPKSFTIENAETLGLQLVITLVEQLDGNIRLEKTNGIKYFITFEKQKL